MRTQKNLFKRFPTYPIAHFNPTQEFSLYRIVKEHTPPEKLFKQHLSYPPIEKTPLGRCNYKGEPLFYAGDNVITAILETELNINESFYISKWTVRNPSSLRICTSFLSNYNGRVDAYNVWKGHMHDLIEKSFRLYNIEYNKKILRLLTDALLGTNKKLSAFIAQHAIREGKVHGLIFPSIKKEKEQINFAFLPSCVDSHFELDFVLYGKLNSINDENGQISKVPMVGKVDNDSKIVWHFDKSNEFWDSLLVYE